MFRHRDVAKQLLPLPPSKCRIMRNRNVLQCFCKQPPPHKFAEVRGGLGRRWREGGRRYNYNIPYSPEQQQQQHRHKSSVNVPRDATTGRESWHKFLCASLYWRPTAAQIRSYLFAINQRPPSPRGQPEKNEARAMHLHVVVRRGGRLNVLYAADYGNRPIARCLTEKRRTTTSLARSLGTHKAYDNALCASLAPTAAGAIEWRAP